MLDVTFDLDSIIAKAKDLINLDGLVENIKGWTSYIPQPIMDFYNANTAVCSIVIICLLVLVAFEGYRLFKMALYVVSAGAFAIGGFLFIAPEVSSYLDGIIPDIVVVDILIAAFLGLLAVFLTRCAYNFMIMLLGAIAGYFVGSMLVVDLLRGYFNTLEFLQNDITAIIVGVLCAGLFALIFILMFKHCFMIGTSFGCLILAAYMICKLLIPTADAMVKLAAILVGIAVGVFACVRQYREEEKALEIVF